MSRKRKGVKRPVVQLTSLLDLLFVMIFVSLLQTKSAPSKDTTPKSKPKPVARKPKEKPKPEKPTAPEKFSVDAVFHFYATAKSPEVPSGIFAMGGTFDSKTGELKLGGTHWIKRPPSQGGGEFDMVPLSGTIDSKLGTFTGRIEFPNCREFNLYRTVENEGSPIAGKWEGSYTCYQGETGLTLTIQ